MKDKVKQMFMMKKNHSEIAHFIGNQLNRDYIFKTVGGTKVDDIYLYDEGIYLKGGRDLIRGKSEEWLGVYSKTQLVNEIVNKIVRMTLVKREALGNSDSNLICLDNGVFNIVTKELSPHNSKYGFTSKLPVKYSKPARCPKIHKFIEEVLYDEHDIEGMQEWLGVLLYREYLGKKAAIFLGGTDTGKTTMLNLIERFIGTRNISGVSLQKLAGDKFASSELFGKHVNVCDELSEKDVDDVDTFKMVTGKSQISGEFKYGDSFQFVNFAKLMFATNKSPNIKVSNEDEAYYNRWLIWRFDNKFDKKDKSTNPNMVRDMTSDKELSGLLNWALEGLGRIMRKGFFTNDKDTLTTKMILQRDANPMAAFVQDSLEQNAEGWMSKQELYDAFVEYCRLNNMGICTMDKFGKTIRVFCPYIENGRKGLVNGWRNISLKAGVTIFGV